MTARTLHAHFDGERILLDEPCELEPDTKLIVTVLPKEDPAMPDGWITLSAMGLEAAYGENEVEYLVTAIKEKNAEYEGR